MATNLTVAAIEESTYVVVAAFTDEDGTAVVPATVSWSLTDIDGTIINSREDVSETPAATVNIVLTGDDLATTATIDSLMERVVTVSATYDSDYGTGLKLKAAATFLLEDLLTIP